MKIIGCVLIFLSSILCSYYYERYLKIKISKLEELILFVSYIKSKIEYFSIPLSKIYQKYENKTKFIDSLIHNFDYKEIQISKEVDSIICEFFSSLGKGYKQEQIALCNYTTERLNANLSLIKATSPNKIKIFRALSLFIGISIIILLV